MLSYQKGRLGFKKKMQMVNGKQEVVPLTHVTSTQLLKPTGTLAAKVNNLNEGGSFTEKQPFEFEEEADNLRENFTLIEAEQLTYQKPILIIYNPISGKRVNLRQTIADALKAENIPSEFYESTGYMDAFKKA